MIFPTTYEMTLLLSVLSMICWGSWANTLKLTRGKWRFELYYFDYAFGVVLAAAIAALTFGSMGDELSFQDNVMIAGKRQMAWAMAAGAVFNLANMLLVAAISIAGMSVAFPIGIGLALILGTVGNYIVQSTGNPLFIFGGVGLVLIAIIVDALAYSTHSKETSTAVAENANQKRRKKSGAAKGIVIAAVAGILMGSFYPLLLQARAGGSELGLGPYAIALFFSIGVLLSTMIYNLYFINLPVEGEATSIGEYFRGSFRFHVLGVLGGAIWSVGAVANFVAGAATGKAQIGPAVSYALGQGATMVGVLWGLLVWKEFRGASGKTMGLLALMFICFAAGLALISIAPLKLGG